LNVTRDLIERSGAAENREEGSTNSSQSGFDWPKRHFSRMGKSIRHLRFRGRFEQRMGIFPKIIGALSETFESALPG
jgi:hypothetical protein